LTAAVAVAATWPLIGCSGGKTAEAKRLADDRVPVTVGYVVEKPMSVELRAIGTVEAYSTVVVKSQIQGELYACLLYPRPGCQPG
jgi:multidrug efflux pump subunit AcrA (membrane-fusion protein)